MAEWRLLLKTLFARRVVLIALVLLALIFHLRWLLMLQKDLMNYLQTQV